MTDLKTIANGFVQEMQPRIGTSWMKPLHATIGRPTDGAVFVTGGNFPDNKQVYVHFVTDGDVISVIEALAGSYTRDDLRENRPVLLKKNDAGLFYIADLDPVKDAIFSEGIEKLDNQKPVYLNQLVEICTLHPIVGSLQFNVSPGKIGDVYISGLTSADFSTGTVQDTTPANITLPTTNGLAKGVLVQLDTATPALEYKQSATFDSVLSLPQAYKAGLLPAKDTDRKLLGYVKLTYGSTVFDYDSIWQTPELIGGTDNSAPADATYIVQTANATLTNEQALSTLATGLLGVTTTTGVLSSGGTTGATDNAVLRADGVGGKTVQSSGVLINDNGRVQIAVTADSDGLWIKQHAAQTIDPMIITDSDENDQIRFLPNGGAIFNEEGNDVDFRIETDTNANAFFVDGGNNNVGIGTGTPDASAMLDIVSTAKGLGLPSMTTAQRNAIGTPRDGLIVYDSDLDLVFARSNGAWVACADVSTAQTLTNKTLTTPTIADFTNATHNHTNAAGGGQITDAALSAAVGIAKGGTGQTTQTAAMDALSPTTTKGDLLVDNGTNVIRLAVGATNGHSLQVDSGQAAGIKWAAQTGATITTDDYIFNDTADWQTNSTSLVDIDATDMTNTITTTGKPVLVHFHGSFASSANLAVFLDFTIDGTVHGGNDGVIKQSVITGAVYHTTFTCLVTGLSAASHEFRMQWKVSANTVTLYAGAGTANNDLHSQFWVQEIS